MKIDQAGMMLRTTIMRLGRVAPLLALALLIGCWSQPKRRFPEASEAGRRACVEEVQANYAPQGRVEAMKKCLATIDKRLVAQRKLQHTLNPAALPSSGETEIQSLTAQERLLYCRLHQEEVQAAERERQKRQSLWITASSRAHPGSASSTEAKVNYEQAINQLNTLIPESYRAGLPLVPDAISAYQSCMGPLFK
ncbi:hypothetical protein [Synechococcus sp. CS-1328]|uniref:hypothetical protein n=1 Tax=Synechococcus sp. CS-1328 TaxID=2847976 RepID=UPI00223C2C92|nr:hypothetical protein [Synechococcus sp. CS-1328]MCT0224851.1 hypothetical protein [Synechococcus sp. CS-1328]